MDRGLFVLRRGRMLSGVVLNCDSSDLDDFRDCFIVIVSSLAEPGRGIVPGPGDEGVEEVFAVGEGAVGAAPLQVFMDCHEGGEPEAGGDYPADERMGLGRGLAVGAGRRGLEAMLPGQPAEPEEGELGGQFPLEGADAGSQGAQGMHVGFTSFSFVAVDGGVENFSFAGHLAPFSAISGHFRAIPQGWISVTPMDTSLRRYDGGGRTVTKPEQ